jgi:hypothetical protein
MVLLLARGCSRGCIRRIGRLGVSRITDSSKRFPAPKPDRAGSSPAKEGSRAGGGRRGVVRGCPLGTGQDCCDWHVGGTAGENDDAHAWRRRLSARPEGETQPRVMTALLASREGAGSSYVKRCSCPQRYGGPFYLGQRPTVAVTLQHHG